MSNVLLLYDKPSVIFKSISTQVKGFGHEVYECSLSISDMEKYKGKAELIFIYADDDIADNTQTLVYLKDMAIEHDIPIYFAGENSEYNVAIKSMPVYLIRQKYSRPINAREIAEDIDKYLKDSSRNIKKKILVVDDSGAMLRNVKGWLEDKYQIVLANSGTMAIKYLAVDRPDLVLLDYEMPVIDGKQVLQMIRSEMEFEDIPVIFLTSKGDRESVMEVMSLKPEGYLLKTMPPQDIISTVDNFFEKKRLEQLSV